jgi:hypothetical protein
LDLQKLLLLPETVDAPALAQEMAELRAARSASVHHHAPPTLVGPPPEGVADDASVAPDDPSAYEAILEGLKPEHAVRRSSFWRHLILKLEHLPRQARDKDRNS